MREELIKNGKLIVLANQRAELLGVVKELEKEGHATGYAYEIIDDKVLCAEAYHFRTCARCERDKR